VGAEFLALALARLDKKVCEQEMRAAPTQDAPGFERFSRRLEIESGDELVEVGIRRCIDL
jgi:hypothetical protein